MSDIETSERIKKRFSSHSAGFLLSRSGLLFLLAGLLVAARFGQIAIVIMLGMVLSAAGISLLWSRLSLLGVSCERSLNERRAFPGENIELKLRLANRKLLPLPWIQVNDEIPVALTSDQEHPPSERRGFVLLNKAAALLWYTAVSWKQSLSCGKRGYYELGPITLTSGDIFGFYPRSVSLPLIDRVIVYPKIYPINRLGIPSMQPVGDITAERRIFEDPVRVIGVRDYNPDDSPRRIHWKASARHQSLQVKVFEPTISLKAAVFLAVDSFQHDSPDKEADFELAISAAASAASHLIEQRSTVGLFVNSRLADSGQAVAMLPGGSTNHLVEILEALAKVTAKASDPFEEFLQLERMKLPWGTTLVFILSKPSPSLVESLITLRQRGERIFVLQVGDPGETNYEHSLAWHNLKQPGDLLNISAEGVR